jgi:uncharacterized membrane protein
MIGASLPTSRFSPPEFRIGRVFSESWSVLTGNFVKLCLVTGIVSLPSVLLRQFLPAGALDPLGGPAQVNPSQMNPSAIIGPVAVFFVVLILLMPISEAIIFYIAVQHMRRSPVNLVEGLEVGLRRFFPLIGIRLLVALALVGVSLLAGILAGVIAAAGAAAGTAAVSIVVAIAVGLCMIVFGVGYFMLIMMWSVAGPVCVVERLGPMKSLGRSRELTKGHRWKIFGLTLLLLLCTLPLVIASGAAGYFLTPVLRAAIGLIWNAIWLAFFWITYVVTYRDLRVAKEGIDTDQVATVFE